MVDPYSIYQQSTWDWGGSNDWGNSFDSYGNGSSWGGGGTDYNYLMDALQQAQNAYDQRKNY